MSTTLLVRKSTKQAWSQASKVEMLDSVESLQSKLEGMNSEAGFQQFDVVIPEGYDPKPFAAQPTVTPDDDYCEDTVEPDADLVQAILANRAVN